MVTERKNVIRVDGITATYGDAVILRDIEFEVYEGEVFAILGGSGCGKTTLMRQMIGLIKPSTGRIWIHDTDITTAKGTQREQVLRQIGVMYQHGALFGTMNLLENICLVLGECTQLPREAMRLIAQMKLKVVGLLDSAYKMPAEISGGMRKRAALARAMALGPKILFLDEPSAGLDPITSAQMDELIGRLAKSLKITFVIVSHELPSVFAVADRVIMLDGETKTIVASGKPDELRKHSDNPWIRQFFNRRAEAGPG